MNITATLFGQMITFVIFVWFIKAYLWEPLTQAMEDRTNKISEGLASAELGEKKIEEANIEYNKIIDDAKQKASDVIAMAQQQSGLMIDDAKATSKKEADKIISLSNQQLAQDVNIAKEQLKNDISRIAIECAEKIIKAEINEEKHKAIFDDALKELK
jgi:F-type H+-transporting ATPase subunit b|tara:strand:+ start:359 stop:832 length:474 start_codon:yes stop_codon:yes gene_type:complete